MLRGENVAAGTSTTGTGTLTLAACPATVGGVNFDIYLKAVGFVSGNAVLVPYVITEFTDSTFATPKVTEKGWGTLTLGAAIANATLARTKVQVVSNPNAGTYSDQGPSAFSIGTAANVVVFIGAAAADLLAMTPFRETTLGDNVGILPIGTTGGTLILSTDAITGGGDYYWPYVTVKPIQARRATARVSSGSTTTSSASFRLYAVGTNGRPGKLIVDFGALGGANPLGTLGNIASGLLTPGVFLPPGEYFGDLFLAYSGSASSIVTQNFVQFGNLLGTVNLSAKTLAVAFGGTSTATDPAFTTGYAYTSSLVLAYPAVAISDA